MNCHTLFFLGILLTLFLPATRCHSLSKRKAKPLFHLLFPNRRRLRKHKKYRLITPKPHYFVAHNNQLEHEHDGNPPPPVRKPGPYHVDSSYPEGSYNGPNHVPQNNFDYDPPEWFEADEYGNPHEEGHFDFEGFGPFDEEDHKNQNNDYEEPSNHYSPHPPKVPVHPSQSSYSGPPHSGSYPPQPGPHPPNSGPRPPHSGPHPPHSRPHPPNSGPRPPHSGPHPSNSGPHSPHSGPHQSNSPPHPGPYPDVSNENPPHEINHVHFHVFEPPSISDNEITTITKPVKFPNKENDQPGPQKDITNIVKETIYYGEYPIKNIVVTKDSVPPLLLPAGVNGLDPNTLEFIKEKVKEYARVRQNRNQ